MKVASVLILAILAHAAGNLLLSRAMKQAGGDLNVHSLLRIAENPMVWIGTALLILFFVLYSASLSWADLSFVLPATAFGYILNVAFAHHFLQETVSPLRWFGTILIAIGLLLVSKAGPGAVKDNSV